MTTCTHGFSVASALDAHVAATEDEREPDGCYHPSGLFSCERQAIYGVRGVPQTNPVDAQTKRVFRVGHELHRIVQTAVSSTEGSPETEVVFHEVKCHSPKLNLLGHADSLRMWIDEEADELLAEVIEYKSIKESSLRYKNTMLPREEHVAQALVYAWILRHEPWYTEMEPDVEYLCPNCQTPWKCNGPHEPQGERWEPRKPLGDRLRQVRICYISKDDLNIIEFPVPVTDEGERKLEEYVARLDKYRNDETALPPRIFPGESPPTNKIGRANFPCGWCSWETKCWIKDGIGVEL